MPGKAMSILQHLEELRRVLIISLISLIPTTIIGWIYRENILAFIIQPVMAKNVKLVYLTPTEPFFVMFKVAIFTGLVLAMPIILWQFWGFILPALKKNEKYLLGLLVPLSFALFIGGILFGYFTAYKFGINFFINFASNSALINLVPTFKISDFLAFAISFLLPFGVVFELPLVVLVLAKMGFISASLLARHRKYAVLIIFIIAAIITPTPDIFTQTMVAVPLYILYEISIFLAYLAGPKKNKLELA